MTHDCIAQCRPDRDEHYESEFVDGAHWRFTLLRGAEPETAPGATRNGQDHAAPPAPAPGAVVVSLADVQSERVSWLWPGRVPLGKLTILDGDPGLGKSAITTDLAARVSTGGAMPDGTRSDLDGPAGVVLLSAEDGLADTIRPRLDAAGADVSRIVALTAVPRLDLNPDPEQPPRVRLDLPTIADLSAIREAIARVDARLVIVDPLMAYLPSGSNSYRDQDVRRVLAPLAVLAAELDVAVVVIRHLNKMAGGNPLYRGGGSIGIIGAARSGLLVAPDPDQPDGARRILASTKSNLSEPPPALAYHLEAVASGAVRVVWEGAVQHTASSLLAQSADGEERGALAEARDFLREVLADGPRPARDVQREARDASITEITLRRARSGLVKIERAGFGAAMKTTWSLQFCSSAPSFAHPKMMSKTGGDEQNWSDPLPWAPTPTEREEAQL
ncbi:MAG: AAA family ATPase [Chloroflexi bacterium]|nr:AAA family ATPase [Chloroflexota bacterium]